MAERLPRPSVRPSVWNAYRTLLGSRLGEQTSYRTSFTLDVIGAIAISLTELIEVYVIFHNVPVFGGVRLDAAQLIYGLSYLAFGLANTFAGNLDTVLQFVRTGTLDVLMLRPLPILGQMLTSEVTLKRFRQTIPALAIMVFALLRLDDAWSPASIVLLSIAPICGALIFAALFLLAGAAQFWLLDGAEVTSSFTYGSSYASSFSAAVMPMPLRVFFSFIIPATFVGYLPTVTVLGLPGAAGLPTGLGYFLPVVAVLAWCAALLAWRMGLRRYVGAGG